MGLRDRLKRKSGKKEDDDIDDLGGLTLTDTSLETTEVEGSDSEEESDLAMGDLDRSLTGPGIEESLSSEDKASEGDKDGNVLAGLDIFTSEELEEDDEHKLADRLPQVDIHELSRECREVVAQLEEGASEP